MILKKQTRTGPKGNCFEACVASLLEVEVSELPNLSLHGNDSWFDAMQGWLVARGWYAIAVEFDGKAFDPVCIAVGDSPRGNHKHAILWRRGRIVHDPYPVRPGERKGLERNPGYLVFLVPLDPSCYGKQP